MKIAVSIPDPTFERAEHLAARLGYSRSQLYAKALEAFVALEGDDPVTAALDALADHQDMSLDTALDQQGRSLIESGQWEW